MMSRLLNLTTTLAAAFAPLIAFLNTPALAVEHSVRIFCDNGEFFTYNDYNGTLTDKIDDSNSHQYKVIDFKIDKKGNLVVASIDEFSIRAIAVFSHVRDRSSVKIIGKDGTPLLLKCSIVDF